MIGMVSFGVGEAVWVNDDGVGDGDEGWFNSEHDMVAHRSKIAGIIDFSIACKLLPDFFRSISLLPMYAGFHRNSLHRIT